MLKIKRLLFSIFIIGVLSINGSQGQIILLNQKWMTGQTINILFMNGEKTEKDLFKKAVGLWSKYVNLDFEFHSIKDNENKLPNEFRTNTIRVKFNEDEGNFSPLGTNFNLGFFDKASYLNIKEPSSKKITFISKSVHEMGHALGLIHEHQHPDAKSYKDETEMIGVCKYLFMLDITKDEELKKCKVNLQGISDDDIEEYDMRLSSFDKDSIMLYSDLSTSSKGFFDTSISLNDKIFMNKEYSFDKALSEEDIRKMHSDDIQEERQWILSEYNIGSCSLIQEDETVLITKRTESRLIKFKINAMSLIDNYFTSCTATLK